MLNPYLSCIIQVPMRQSPYLMRQPPSPNRSLSHDISNSTTIIHIPLYVTGDHNKMNHSAKIIQRRRIEHRFNDLHQRHEQTVKKYQKSDSCYGTACRPVVQPDTQERWWMVNHFWPHWSLIWKIWIKDRWGEVVNYFVWWEERMK